MGAALGALGGGWAAAAGAGVLVSAAIELVQTALPGRYPTAGDIVANGLGALLGALLWRRFTLGVPPLWTWTTAAVVGLMGTAVLSVSAPPSGLLYGQYTPELGSLDVYQGRVLEAEVGGRSVGSGPLDDSDSIREGLRARESFSVRFRVGPPPADWAPLFAIFSHDREEALLVAIRGDDVLVRWRSLASALRFAEPSMIVRGALAGLDPGEAATLSGRVERAGFCIETSAREACGLGPDAAEGWRFLRRDVDGTTPRRLLSAGLIALLASLMLLSGRPRRAAAVIAGLCGLVLVLPWATPLAGPRPFGLTAGLAAAVLFVGGLGWGRRRTPEPATPSDPGSPRHP